MSTWLGVWRQKGAGLLFLASQRANFKNCVSANWKAEQAKNERINWCIRDLKSLQKRSLHSAGSWVADWQDKRRHYNLSSNTCSTVTSVHRDHEWTRRCFLLTSAKQRSRKRSRTQTPVRCICSWLRNNTEVTHLRRQRRRITRLPTCACFWRHRPTNQPRASVTLLHCGKRSLAG